MFLKKSLVLLGTKKESEKAVMSLEKKGDLFEGRIRLYNFKSEPNGILSIGFYNKNKVLKAGLVRASSMLYTFKLDASSEIDDFSCAVVNFDKAEASPILYGSTYNGEKDIEKIGKVMSESFEKPVEIEKVKKILDENKIEYSDELQKEIEDEIEKNFCGDCANCKYKKIFYGEKQENDVHVKNFKDETKPSFYDEIKKQIDNIFEKNDKEEFLEEIIPNSKWVKVEYEQSGDYYILGLIYEEDEIKYIVYGVPGVYQKNPPKEISGYPVWFPLDSEKKESFGYWLSYQDAKTGESIKAVVE